jgi:tetratricopeptide (TPR) repeat protein
MFLRLKYLFILIVLILLIGCPTGPYIKVNKSIEELQSSVQEDPNDPVAYYNLGVGYTAKKQYEEALEYFHKALEIEPHFSDAYFAIYCVEFAKDKKLYKKAFDDKEYDPETEKKINEVRSYFNYALFYNPFFDWKISTIFLERSPYSDTPFTPMIIKIIYDGIAKFRTGNYEKAIERFDYVIEEWPEYRLPYFLRGISQAQLQKYEEAIKDFRFLIDKLEEYNKEKVLPIYLNPAELYYWIGFAYLKQEKLDKAEETFKKVIMENMGFYMAHYQISNICKMRGDYAGALKEVDAAIIAKPDDPIFHFSKGVCLNTMSRDWEAMQEYNNAISINPKFYKSYYALAIILESIGNKEEAAENYQNFIDKAPKSMNEFIEKAQTRIDSLEKEQTLEKN